MTVQDAVNWCNQQVGKSLDFDGVYGAQCVDLFSFYYQLLTGRSPFQDAPGVPGAKDLWNLNYPGFSKALNNPNDENQLPPQGAILIYDGGLPGSGGFGHVAIVDTASTQQVTVWDQNWGGQFVHHQAHMWTGHELGWMVFDGFTTPAPVFPFTIEQITPKDVTINKPTHKWNLAYDNITAIVNDPVDSAAPGDLKHVSALLHHNIGYTYYLEDANIPQGYNVVDCDDVPAPAPAPVVPRPIPTAPLTAPSLDPYTVVVDVPGYLSPGQALAHSTPGQATVRKGTYTIYNRQGGMVNVTDTPGKPGWWINPIDNAVAPFVSAFPSAPAPKPATPPDWRTTYRPFVDRNGIRIPVKYVAVANYVVEDLEGRKADVPLHTGDTLYMGGTFTKDGEVWGRPQDAIQDREGTYRGWWYGIPVDGNVVEPYAKLYSPKTTVAERQVLDAMTIYDYVVIAIEHISRVLQPVWSAVTFKPKHK